MRPNGELPSDHYEDRRRQTPELRREAHRAVHRPSACSGVKALRNTSDAKAARRQAALAFRSLDPFRALREPDRRRRTKNGFPAPNKERSAKPTKQPLDRKSPIQVCCEPDFLRFMVIPPMGRKRNERRITRAMITCSSTRPTARLTPMAMPGSMISRITFPRLFNLVRPALPVAGRPYTPPARPPGPRVP